MSRTRKVFVAGHRGMVGSAICRRLEADPSVELLTQSRSELDLRDAHAVDTFVSAKTPDEIYLSAAKVGGIHANNTMPADFIADNLNIQSAIIQAAFRHSVKKLLFLGSSCIYPRLAAQPMVESSLLTGTLETTNEPYAVAKIAGIKLCESYNRQHGTDFRSVMPTNLYGPGDNFHPDNSHVLPALMRRFYEAAQRNDDVVTVWGTGQPRREFLHVDDMAAACVHVMDLPKAVLGVEIEPMQSHINVGTGTDHSIAELATLIADITGFEGKISFDRTKPDGTPRKLLDVSRLTRLGWSSQVSLSEGLEDTFKWFSKHQADLREA